MKYLGWILSLILIIGFYYSYRTQYLPIRKTLDKLQEEITMWEGLLKDEKGLVGDRNRAAVDRFFENDKLTPYAEVEILRRFDRSYKGIEIYLSSPHALDRAKDLLRFMAEQRVDYQNMSFFVVLDSTEKFEYKFVK